MSFRCEITFTEDEYTTNIYDMSPGTIGITKDNQIYLKTAYCATCLSEIGGTYSTITAAMKGVKIKLLPKGTKITLEVE